MYAAAPDFLTSTGPRYVAPLLVNLRQSSPFEVEVDLSKAEQLPPAASGAVQFLAHQLVQQFVIPAIRAKDGEGYERFLMEHFHEYCETLQSLHVCVARALSEERAAVVAEARLEAVLRDLCEKAAALAGDSAAEEVDFTFSTFRRAARIVGSFARDGLTPEQLELDRGLARKYHASAAIHCFGVFSLLAAGSGIHASASVIDKAFELLRSGALDAYSAAREAWELRQPVEPAEQTDFPEQFDANDVALANTGLADSQALLRRAAKGS